MRFNNTNRCYGGRYEFEKNNNTRYESYNITFTTYYPRYFTLTKTDGGWWTLVEDKCYPYYSLTFEVNADEIILHLCYTGGKVYRAARYLNKYASLANMVGCVVNEIEGR